jgi:hypothetical protein
MEGGGFKTGKSSAAAAAVSNRKARRADTAFPLSRRARDRVRGTRILSPRAPVETRADVFTASK